MIKKLGAALVMVVGLVVVAIVIRGQAEPNRLPPEVVRVLEAADSFVLLSLDPAAETKASPEVFHEEAVLGRADIRDPEQRRQLLQALYDGIGKAEGQIAKCWNPRHGIRATHGEEVVDLVICFECLHLEYYAGHSGVVLTTGAPEKLFSRALEAAGVPRPGAPK
ncbi:MAG: hypothetical protein R3E87_27250 [Burkholderiaceae bacterium]